jgi:hypothetical protein
MSMTLTPPSVDDTSVELLEMLDLPKTLILALGSMPRRLLFHSATADIIQVGLHHGQVLRDLALTDPGTVIVTFGCARLEQAGLHQTLLEGNDARLVPSNSCRITAVGQTDLLLVFTHATPPDRLHPRPTLPLRPPTPPC